MSQTANKNWVPQIVGASVAIAYVLGKPSLRLGEEDASMINDAVVFLLSVALPEISYWVKNYAKENAPAWTPYLKYGAALGIVGIIATAAWRFL